MGHHHWKLNEGLGQIFGRVGDFHGGIFTRHGCPQFAHSSEEGAHRG